MTENTAAPQPTSENQPPVAPPATSYVAPNAAAAPAAPAAPGMAPMPVEKPKQGMAITAVSLGGVAFLTGIILPGLAVICGLLAVIFGIVAAVKKQHKIMWILGIVLGIIGGLTGAALIIIGGIIAVMLQDPEFQQTLLDSGVSVEQLEEMLEMFGG